MDYPTDIQRWLLALSSTYLQQENMHEVTNKNLILWILYIRLFMLTLDDIYLLTQFSHVTISNTTAVELMNFYIHTSTRFVSNALWFSLIYDLEDNVVFTTRRRWKECFGRWGSDFTGNLEQTWSHFARFVCIFISIQCVFPVILHFQNRMSRRYWGSQYLPLKLYNSPLVVILSALNEINLGTLSIFVAGYTAILLTTMFILCQFWITNLATKMTEHHGRSFDSRYDRTPFLQYRTHSVVSRIGNACIGTHLIPVMLGYSSLVIIVLLSALVNFANRLPVEISCNLVIGAALLVFCHHVVYHVGGVLINTSIKLKRYFTLEYSPYSRKFVRSCSELRVYSGFFFYVKSGIFVTSMRFIADQVIDVTLAFKT